ncbi:hypothetical protein ACFWF3_35340, partial [Nocardia sp. NPDC060220]|uniref:hypothetical protein n=1 Tax=Nocardia sp. NPDC060220 TaxID=3347076 RepID=UPI00366776A1
MTRPVLGILRHFRSTEQTAGTVAPHRTSPAVRASRNALWTEFGAPKQICGLNGAMIDKGGRRGPQADS